MEASNNWDLILHEWKNSTTTEDKRSNRLKLEAWINDLLLHDFNTLLSLLYRIDVNEKKLKQLLHEQPAVDASVLITTLILERMEEKEISRNLTKKDQDVPEDERW